MKSVSFASLNRKRRQAMALILVIVTVALLSMLIVAIFSITRTEYKATQSYVAGKSAKQLGDGAVAIVEAQIQNAQHSPAETGGQRTTHATQPGMVRVYNPDGSFKTAYKLYSSGIMQVQGSESSLYTDEHVAPSNWDAQPARFVDLNEPIVRPGLSTTGETSAATYAVYFPIIDPRAAWNYGGGEQSAGENGEPGTTQVEGFSYTKKVPTIGGGGGQDYSTKVVTPSDTTTPDKLRLPMPVEWLYILQDGTVGALNDGNKFISSTPGTEPSAINPIVGRIAFWTDDESCKININTASEPTYLSTPFYYHERDARWAHFPPVTGEYQRYPGHPATVALSSVLAPNFLLDPLLPQADKLSDYMEVVGLKEEIYDFAPKIARGGSEAGTRPFVRDELSDQNGEREASKKVDLSEATKERLYASVDEMIFRDREYDTTNGRGASKISLPNGANFFDNDRLEHSRFFLTAQSRSPEFSIHGLPRICMWPVADESKGAKWRTSFDNAIALCATIKKNAASSDTATRSYFFRRAVARNSTSDVVNIQRNGLLLDYLASQMSTLTYPATSYSGGGRSSFQDKYGEENINQMAVQFFDYIRCTNLYDGILARRNDAWSMKGKGAVDLYNFSDQNQNSCYTFTSQRITEPPNTINNVTAEQGIENRRTGEEGVLPGHGQVSPAIWAKGGRDYKGFGRFLTLSEIGFQFICTADGQIDDGSLTTFPNAQEQGRGGGTARRLDPSPENNHPPAGSAYVGFNVGGGPAQWWSNFPPLLPRFPNENPKTVVEEAIDYYGCERTPGSDWHPSRHPGFDPKNWNFTLAAGTPLQSNQKRVQVMLMLELFCPSLGWTGMYPEFTIVLDRNSVSQMKLKDFNGNDEELFSTSGDLVLKSNGNIMRAQDCHMSGGHVTPTAVAGGRRMNSISGSGGTVLLPADSGYESDNTSGHAALQNFAFSSSFVTVNRNQNLEVTFPSEKIQIKIFDTHNYESAQPVQTHYVDFSNVAATIPMPNLADSKEYREDTDSYGRVIYTRSRQGPHFWCANYEGCVGLYDGLFNSEYDGTNNPWSTQPFRRPAAAAGDAQGANVRQALRGRLDISGRLITDERSNVSGWRDLSIIAGARNGEGKLQEDGSGELHDVIRTLVPASGDYRTLAAMHEVPSEWWQPHPSWDPSLDNVRQAHSFTGFSATAEPGAKLAVEVGSAADIENNYEGSYRSELQLIGGARFDVSANQGTYKSLHPRQADLPPDPNMAAAANAFGDFDTGISSAHEGAYINKPDEGNYYAAKENRSGQNKYWRSSYFFETWQNAEDWRSGIYMTPNRLISSPVMFGSLPTGVWGNPGGLPSANDLASLPIQAAPWQTLLFRPHAQITSQQPSSHTSHPGLDDPSDHYLLDLFFMPVVEPYAISEPLSVAGRINMNYQIMPFTNIRRATAMHAVMKGEYITAIPNNHITASKEYYPGQAVWNERFWSDSKDKRYWHRPIDVRATLRQFDLKFEHASGGNPNYQGLFRSASQICEMHLIPKIMTGGSGTSNPPATLKDANSQETFNNAMNSFWGDNRPTGDNVRERPYSNLYARLTTRSNTFRVHVRTQVLRKARSTAPDTFDPAKDAVNGEYRGSYLLERYIDPNDPDTNIPDYASSGSPFGGGKEPLDTFYRFRVLETKRFNP